MAEKNLIVYEGEYKSAATVLTAYGQALANMITQYESAVDTILKVAIKDDKISPAIESLKKQVVEQRSNIEQTASALASSCNKYAAEIASEDSVLTAGGVITM